MCSTVPQDTLLGTEAPSTAQEHLHPAQSGRSDEQLSGRTPHALAAVQADWRQQADGLMSQHQELKARCQVSPRGCMPHLCMVCKAGSDLHMLTQLCCTPTRLASERLASLLACKASTTSTSQSENWVLTQAAEAEAAQLAKEEAIMQPKPTPTKIRQV